MHDTPPHGRVTGLYPGGDYGKITTRDGREIYFHRNGMLGADFDSLDIGSEERFAEKAGDNRPQASSASLIGNHHTVG